MHGACMLHAAAVIRAQIQFFFQGAILETPVSFAIAREEHKSSSTSINEDGDDYTHTLVYRPMRI